MVKRTVPSLSSSRIALVLAALVVSLGGTSSAHAQVAYTANVTSVVDGDTLHARLSDGRDLTVRLIGIDTPETRDPSAPVECGGREATDAMEELVLERAVALRSDPTQGAVDRFGRSLFYVDRTDGLDVGLEMIRRGWSRAYVFDRPFQRLPAYQAAEAEAEAEPRGVWDQCGGAFHGADEDVLDDRRESAERFVRRYYRRLSRRQYRAAWRMLGLSVRRGYRHRFRSWRAGYRGSLGVTVLSARSRLRGSGAVVRVGLRSRDRDACTRRVVRQRFRGDVKVAPRGDSWAIVKFRITKTRGKTPRQSRSQCPRGAPRRRAPSAPPSPPRNCQGYIPCLPPGPDVDCEGGSGNGPRYVSGPVTVRGRDPYDLDRDDDGMGCDS